MSYLGWVSAVALLAAVPTPAQVVLPDAPSFVAMYSSSESNDPDPAVANPTSPAHPVPSPKISTPGQHLLPCPVLAGSAAPAAAAASKPCIPLQNPIQPFVDADRPVVPLTSRQKGHMAFHDVTDPFNLLTIAGNSAYFIATTPHNPYGPGMHGFGYNAGVSLLQDATGETIGTFAVCSLFHEDPRYFRMPKAKFMRRVAHAVVRVAVAQGDNGRPMINYANLITSPVSAVISNQYVPGIATDPASTAERIFGGFLTEPIGTLIAEFLPDVASHVHINIVIVQRYLNQISGTQQQSQTTTP